jgi:lysophospholipase L1-like esterase
MIKYLALGDSYTIGEKVDASLNFPNQLVALSSSLDHPIILDKLIAVTGWTTDELATAIEKERPSFDYDLVTLLIGVNNQYRGRSIDEYAWQFYSLVCQAILCAKAEAKNVIVLSIPDWGLTPFNTERDKDVTSKEIDAFNAINKKTALELGCRYIDITGSTREHAEDLLFLAEDGLHYSEKEYQLWAKHIISLL